LRTYDGRVDEVLMPRLDGSCNTELESLEISLLTVPNNKVIGAEDSTLGLRKRIGRVDADFLFQCEDRKACGTLTTAAVGLHLVCEKTNDVD
jgi:hypothetical protein